MYAQGVAVEDKRASVKVAMGEGVAEDYEQARVARRDEKAGG